MSLWKKIILSGLICVLLLLGGITFLIGTTSGLNLLFKIANNWVPGLEIEQVTGGWRDLHLKNIYYQRPGTKISIGDFHLKIKLGCLRYGTLYADKAYLKDVIVAIDSKKILPSSAPPFLNGKDKSLLHFPPPYPISFYRLLLKNLTIKIDDMTISVMDFKSGLHWKEKKFTLMPSILRGLLIALPKVTNVTKEKSSSCKMKNLKIQNKPWRVIIKALSSQPILSKMKREIHLPINFIIQELKGEDIRLIGNSNLRISNILVKGNITDSNIKLDTLHIDSNQGSLNVKGKLVLQDNWPLDIVLNNVFNIDPFKGQEINLKIFGALFDNLKIAANLSGPMDIKFQATTQLAEIGLPLYIEIISKQLSWPFITGDKLFQASNVKLKLSGKISDYKLSLRTTLKGEGIRSAAIILDAKGNEQRIYLNQLTIAALGGKAKLKGLLDWKEEAIIWCGDLKLTNINSSKTIPNWPSELDGLIKSCGNLNRGNWKVDALEIKLCGNINQKKLKVDGFLKGNRYLPWMVPRLHLAIAHNTIDIKGGLGLKDLDLNISIRAPNLQNALPGVNGSVKGSIQVGGSVEKPKLLANITASDLRWQDLYISHMLIGGEVASRDQFSGKLNLRIEGFSQSGVNISLMTLTGKGTEKKHDLRLRLQGDLVSGQSHLVGSFVRQMNRWKGQLDNAFFTTPFGPMELSRAIALDYHGVKKEVKIGAHCWLSPSVELCIPKGINPGVKGRVVVNFKRFDLAMIEPFILNTMKVNGILFGKVDMGWDITTSKLPWGSMELLGHKVKITKIINGIPLTVAFNESRMNGDLHNNLAQLGWLMQLSNNGQFRGHLEMTDLQRQRNLSGMVRIHNLKFARENVASSLRDKVAGLLNGNLHLMGNVQSPQVFGRLQLYNVDISDHCIPLDVQSSELTMNFSGITSSLMGKVRTSQGEINLSGEADWKKRDRWRARISAKGSRVRINVAPMISLDVSPDVMFEATPNLFSLSGGVDLPWARIVLHEVPDSLIDVSKDEILLNEQLKAKEGKKTTIPINSDLMLHMGNDVQLEAFGLKARLRGDLKMIQNKQGLGLNGQINITEGRFHAYGQDLTVRKGELLFSGLPDQPVVNVEAIRNLDATEDEVIAGVRVIGPLNEAKAELFSVPEMSKQEALSYLLCGKGMNSEQSDSAVITSMLVGLGLEQSGQVIGKIGKTFGIRHLSLDTQGVGDSSQVVVSGYLLPDLQIKYGVRIFDSLATLTLRYRLMPRLYLEILSGINQTLDVIYKIEL